MLAFIGRLAPLAVLLIGLAGGGTIGGGAFWLWNTFVDNPQIVALERARADDVCAIRTADAANRAEAAERAHQQAIMDRALAGYQAAAAAEAKLAIEHQNELEQEIADYETKLTAEGRACYLTQPDLDWLRRKPNSTLPAR